MHDIAQTLLTALLSLRTRVSLFAVHLLSQIVLFSEE